MGGLMKRLPVVVAVAVVLLLALAPAALAHDAGQGWYGEADDKVVTNAGFLLILFFPLFVFGMSMLQGALDRRKERRKKAHKDLAGDERAWRGGW
jgi:O-antigen/teichoic acid export membrane protein